MTKSHDFNQDQREQRKHYQSEAGLKREISALKARVEALEKHSVNMDAAYKPYETDIRKKQRKLQKAQVN